jgi:hypothetical protein
MSLLDESNFVISLHGSRVEPGAWYQRKLLCPRRPGGRRQCAVMTDDSFYKYHRVYLLTLILLWTGGHVVIRVPATAQYYQLFSCICTAQIINKGLTVIESTASPTTHDCDCCTTPLTTQSPINGNCFLQRVFPPPLNSHPTFFNIVTKLASLRSCRATV